MTWHLAFDRKRAANRERHRLSILNLNTKRQTFPLDVTLFRNLPDEDDSFDSYSLLRFEP